METNTIDAQLMKKMFLAGAKNLEAKKEWINELNVFPVPDGDTGTNMTMTIMSAAKEVTALTNVNMTSLAKAFSSGSLRGARGNSGVILSQLIRGFSKTIEKENYINKIILCEAIEKAVETAYKAVMKPKEGTILTVAKGVANKALELSCDDDYPLGAYIDELVQEADHVLAQTPDMLPVLKEAGVVDSGGQGLVQVLKGARDAFMGKEVDYSIDTSDLPSQKIVKITPDTEAEIKFGYCTEFIVVLNRPVSEKEENKFRAYLNSIGDSIVMVSDDDLIKVHVHTNDPGNALQRGLTMGSLTKIKIDNMREEHQERLFKNSEQLAQMQAEGKKITDDEAGLKQERPQKMKDVGFISVCAGEGFADLFREFGVDYVIEGGQTMNPSTEDFMNAIEEVHAHSIFVFPNNKNIILAANQAAALTNNKQIIVIPTSTVPQGITAMVNYIPNESVDENRASMEDVIQTVKTGEVTYAVRDTVIEGTKIQKGDYMGIGDGKILANGPDMQKAAMEMVQQLVDEESSLITVYYGSDVSQDEADAFCADLEEQFEDCEIESQTGGQPIYYYIISVE